MMIASPWPPPEQIAARPSPPPRRFSSSASVSTDRAPLAPIGWPSATAPPLTLTRSGSAPSMRDAFRATLAKASLISNRSIQMPSDQPIKRNISGHRRGLGEVRGIPRRLTMAQHRRGITCGCSSPTRSDAITRAAAPSLTPAALPAVTVPAPLKAGSSFANASGAGIRLGASSYRL